MWLPNKTNDVNDPEFINNLIKGCEIPLYDFKVTFDLSDRTSYSKDYILKCTKLGKLVYE